MIKTIIPGSHICGDLLFFLDTCETCGGIAQAPNAVRVAEKDIPKLLVRGVKLLDELPPELSVREDGTTECDRCTETQHESKTP